MDETGVAGAPTRPIELNERHTTSKEVVVDFEERGSTLHRMGKFRKVNLLVVVCSSQFLTIALLSSLLIANPRVSVDIGLQPTNALWVIASFTLTLAGFLPFGGRLADLYCPKILFCSSLCVTGCLSLGTSFFQDYKGFLVFRGITGVGVTLLVLTFNEPGPQVHALNMFGFAAALGDVLGLVFAGVIMLIGPGNWRWIPRIGSFVSIPLSLVAWIVLPPPGMKERSTEAQRWKRVDFVGALSFTTGIVLFIFSITSGVAHGWKNATFIVTLLVSILLFVAFLIWELRLPPTHALLLNEPRL
ncbi:major facilitator superfamily domain-containing protein [Mrakia frigida]|uniref:major facilitator superfamily domain-containing protein n=1 Tax=Mrakia frigida TaxID=29902 RepID=UPI003FCC245A